jgi:hypothetical protein
MNTLHRPSTFVSRIPHRASVPVDFIIVCLWTTLGLVLTALVFALGPSAEVGQALATAG